MIRFKAAIAVAMLAGCEEAAPPDGVTAALHGVWLSGSGSETLTFDENTNLFTWTDGAETESGTFLLDRAELELSCPRCRFDGRMHVRVDSAHMLIDHVLVGSATVEVGASWTEQISFTPSSPDCGGADQLGLRTLTLRATEALELWTACCSNSSGCTPTSSNLGTWEKHPNGFGMSVGKLGRVFFLLAGGISERRWTRQITSPTGPPAPIDPDDRAGS